MINRIQEDREKRRQEKQNYAQSNQMDQQKKGLGLFGSLYNYLFGKGSNQDEQDVQQNQSRVAVSREIVSQPEQNHIPIIAQSRYSEHRSQNQFSRFSVPGRNIAAKSSPQRFLLIQQTHQANVQRVKKIALRNYKILQDSYENEKKNQKLSLSMDSRIIQPVFYFKNQVYSSYQQDRQIIKRDSFTKLNYEKEKKKHEIGVKISQEEQFFPSLFQLPKENEKKSPIDPIPLSFKPTPQLPVKDSIDKNKEKRGRYRLLLPVVLDAKEDSVKNDKKSEQASSHLSSFAAEKLEDFSVRESIQDQKEPLEITQLQVQVKKESKKKKQLDKFSNQSSEYIRHQDNVQNSDQSQTRDEQEQCLEQIKLSESVNLANIFNKDDNKKSQIQSKQKEQETKEILNSTQCIKFYLFKEEQPAINFIQQTTVQTPVITFNQQSQGSQIKKQEEIENKPIQKVEEDQQPQSQQQSLISPQFDLPENPFLQASSMANNTISIPWMTPTQPYNHQFQNDKQNFDPFRISQSNFQPQTQNMQMNNTIFQEPVSNKQSITNQLPSQNQQPIPNLFQSQSQNLFSQTPKQNLFSLNQPQNAIFTPQNEQSFINQQQPQNLFQQPQQDLFKQQQSQTFFSQPTQSVIQSSIFQQPTSQQTTNNMWNNQPVNQNALFPWSQQNQVSQDPFQLSQMSQQSTMSFGGNSNQQNIQNPFQAASGSLNSNIDQAASLFSNFSTQPIQQQAASDIFRQISQPQQQLTTNDQQRRLNTLKSNMNTQQRI